jgi:nucleotide-binding universal stress UspA family protein
MTTFEHVLVPVDFEEPSECAVDFATRLASASGAKVTLMHASWVVASIYPGYPPGDNGWLVEDLASEARKQLDGIVAKVKETCPRIEGIVVIDEPGHAILKIADERQADLLVVGTHGRHGLSRLMLGSVAERVLRCSRIPVLTMLGHGEREARMKELA